MPSTSFDLIDRVDRWVRRQTDHYEPKPLKRPVMTALAFLVALFILSTLTSGCGTVNVAPERVRECTPHSKFTPGDSTRAATCVEVSVESEPFSDGGAREEDILTKTP